MSARTDIEKRIEKERQKIADLRSQMEKAESFILGLQEALRMVPRDGGGSISKVTKTKDVAALRPGSDMEKTYKLLEQTGKAMHISEILVKIGKEDTKANRLSLASSLSRYARNGELFARPAPNTFSLKDNKGAVSAISLDLPAEFGIEQ